MHAYKCSWKVCKLFTIHIWNFLFQYICASKMISRKKRGEKRTERDEEMQRQAKKLFWRIKFLIVLTQIMSKLFIWPLCLLKLFANYKFFVKTFMTMLFNMESLIYLCFSWWFWMPTVGRSRVTGIWLLLWLFSSDWCQYLLGN